MDEFDTATAFAGVEQRLLFGPLPSTYPACICVFRALLVSCRIGVKCWVVHNIGRRSCLRPWLSALCWVKWIHAFTQESDQRGQSQHRLESVVDIVFPP